MLAQLVASSDMEVDGSNVSSVMASTGTTGSVSISLHPLVIMNVSEHWTRVRAQHDGSPKQGKETKEVTCRMACHVHTYGLTSVLPCGHLSIEFILVALLPLTFTLSTYATCFYHKLYS